MDEASGSGTPKAMCLIVWGGPVIEQPCSSKSFAGGAPPHATDLPKKAIWSIQNLKALEHAKFPSIFCMHMSMDSTKKWMLPHTLCSRI